MTILHPLGRAGTALLAAAISAALAGNAAAAPITWASGDGAWEDPLNWSGGVAPSAADFVEIAYTGAVSSGAPANAALELVSHAALTVGGGQLSVVGTVDSFGALAIGSGASGAFGRVFVQAPGALSVSGAGTTVSVVEGVFSSGTWQMSQGATLHAESFDNFNLQNVEGAAQATANSMINHAGALAGITGAGSRLVINGNLTNDGTVRALAGGALETVSLDNTGGIEVDGGQYLSASVDNHGSVAVRGAAGEWRATDVVTNAGSVRVEGGAHAELATLDNQDSATIEGATASIVELDNRAPAALELVAGASVTVADLALNRGQLTIDASSVLASARYQQLAGVTVLAGGELGASDAFGVDIAGGELRGRGTVAGNLGVGAGGSLAPGDAGDATGRLDILGDLALAGLFSVDIGGTAAADFDQLVASGDALLGGTLAVSLAGGFMPVLGDYFDIVLAGAVGGDFDALLLPALTAGLRFETLVGTDFYRLAVTAVPLPAPLLPALAVLTLLARLSRRRA